jgi:hypothetical protein
MRVLVIENYPNTTLGLVGEALGAAGRSVLSPDACRRAARRQPR